uniref:Putative secreted protein n=1 Tax=Anopheles marajoara TaxID=58244 RepID=A0A2M4CAV7_9DIPT
MAPWGTSSRMAASAAIAAAVSGVAFNHPSSKSREIVKEREREREVWKVRVTLDYLPACPGLTQRRAHLTWCVAEVICDKLNAI